MTSTKASKYCKRAENRLATKEIKCKQENLDIHPLNKKSRF